ncbi:hypothetical protein OFC58_34105, partial [Escherichia coli]|nr:hypothetical protein [Escherichia coli]
QEELDKLTALVRESIGYNAERGDTVQVINAPFRVHKVDEAPEDLPLWKQRETLDLLRNLALPVALVLLGLVVVFAVIRPALRASAQP